MPTQGNLLGANCPPLQAQAFVGLFTNSLTATGSSQGTALAIPSDFVVFTTVAASTGGILPASTGNVAQPGDTYIVVNHGANALSVYPPNGGKIANGSTNAAFSVAASKTAWFLSLGSGNWAALVSA